ncbi:MAG: tRNA (guanosine(37)-N1)-methyltransferase TrmD [Myxococcales bacterium]|nr:tRNA (guanosine(37)-N1)-methyltransferase TrmD [Myxococcales bacterium]
MKFTVVTILPELIEPALTAGVVGRAREAGVISVTTVNPRDFTSDRHRTVDDTPYGGGPGMVMKPEPLLAAIGAAAGAPPAHRVLLSPAGARLTQGRVRELAKLPHLVLVCGRYEGIDERVIELAIDEELSLGDYVLSGGELGALVVIDACARLVPGVLGEPASADEESHSAGLLEYPHYTRPAKLVAPAPPPAMPGETRELDVPPVLQSGNHAAIAAWRRQQSLARTAARRPDLFAKHRPTKADAKLLPPHVADRTHLALVHHPVFDRTGKIVTTSLTNFDIHDLARSSMTYGLAAYHLVTPVTSQREKAEHIAKLWLDETDLPRKPPASGSRAGALARVRTADSIETVIAELTAEYGTAPLVVATSARAESFPGVPRRTPEELVAEAAVRPEPLLVLLGTGWGLADHLIPSVSRLLAPIEGRSDWNHLSVRSAGAILLDRLFGRAP